MSESKSRPRPAGVRVGEGEIETTGIEKFLAVVLAIFIFIGVGWAYDKLDEVAKVDQSSAYVQDEQLLTPEEFSALESHRQKVEAVQAAEREQRSAARKLEFRREAYRTALDAGAPAAELQAEYEEAQARLASASKTLAAATAAENRTRPEALEAKERLSDLRGDAADERDEERVRHDRIVFILRLGLLVAMLGGAYWLLGRLRSRHSRYLPVALAWAGAAAFLACGMAMEYTGSYIEFDEVGPLAISLAGIGLTLGAFIALQRFLAKRVPARRVRRGECPFCGFPVRDKPFCEGCGRAVIGSCSSCQKDRRVGTPRCACCGNP